MDLLKLLREEIEKLNLTDEYEIAYYIYIRMGEIFEYDSSCTYGTADNFEKMAKIRENKRNVSCNKLICFSWAYLYEDLLNSFGIETQMFDDKFHAFVKFKAHGHWFKADLMKDFVDISRIKLGFPVMNFGSDEVYVNHFDIDNKIGYHKGISPNAVLEMILEELKNKKIKKWHYEYTIFKLLETIFLFDRFTVGFTSGTGMIKLLATALNCDCFDYVDFFRLSSEEYMRIYFVYFKGRKKYFCLKEDENKIGRLKEISYTEYRFILENYEQGSFKNYKKDNKVKLLGKITYRR